MSEFDEEPPVPDARVSVPRPLSLLPLLTVLLLFGVVIGWIVR